MKLRSELKKQMIRRMDMLSSGRERWEKRNRYYYRDLIRFLRYSIPEGSRVLEIGCGTGQILDAVKPSYGVGVDISPGMIRIAKKKYPHLRFMELDAEELSSRESFDYIIISDTIGYLEDVQKTMRALRSACTDSTRIIITYHNFIWQPVLQFAEFLHLKMSPPRLNWLNLEDIQNILYLEGYDVVKKGRRFLIPKFFPLVSWFANRFLAYLPGFNRLCITGYLIARMTGADRKKPSVSVIIPARNEKGNIENAVIRTPDMGSRTEIIFIEGHSRDGTLAEIERVAKKHKRRNISFAVQDGKGKGDAVRKGFALAKGDILMILDADLTVPPEDLPKFYEAIANGRGEYINGTRLVYPMEKEAMRFLNMLANKFFSVMFTWLLGQRMKDTLCGTKVLSKKNWDALVANRSYFGDFDPFGDFDLIFGASKLNLKIVEVPIRYQARTYGSTNISRFRHGLLLFRMVLFAMNKIKFV
ncbi:MAG: glycosyltransferase [Spirochaetota bacterium]